MKAIIFFVWPQPVATATCPGKMGLSHGGKNSLFPG